MQRRLTASLAITAAAAMIVTACGSSGARSDPANTPTSSSSRPTGQSARVPAQLQFTAKTIDGHTFSGDSLAGRAAVLWFWTPWCPKCQHEAPIAADVAGAHPRVTFVGVAARDQVLAMQGFVDKYKLSGFIQLADTDGVIWARFGVTQQPAWAFVSANGDVDVVKGSLTQSELNERVDRLVSR